MNIPSTLVSQQPNECELSDSKHTINAWTRWKRGIGCWLTFLITPLGWFCYGRLVRRMEPERLEKGLVLVFTGIEGQSFLNVGILAGLIDGGISSAVKIVDWTTGNRFLFLLHLRGWNRNLKMARQLAQQIVDYQDRYPGRPVWIVGHSGGGGMALLTAEALPEERRLTGIVMLATAISPVYDIRPASQRVETAIWNYYSWFDCLFLILGTTIFGTIDGWHSPSAGAFGFHNPYVKALTASGRLVQVPWNWHMFTQFNLAEHFGCAHRVFISEEIAPLIERHESANSVA